MQHALRVQLISIFANTFWHQHILWISPVKNQVHGYLLISAHTVNVTIWHQKSSPWHKKWRSCVQLGIPAQCAFYVCFCNLLQYETELLISQWSKDSLIWKGLVCLSTRFIRHLIASGMWCCKWAKIWKSGKWGKRKFWDISIKIVSNMNLTHHVL